MGLRASSRGFYACQDRLTTHLSLTHAGTLSSNCQLLSLPPQGIDHYWLIPVPRAVVCGVELLVTYRLESHATCFGHRDFPTGSETVGFGISLVFLAFEEHIKGAL